MNLRPLEGRVVVRRDDKSKQSDGGIFLPDNANDTKSTQGVVLALSDGVRQDDGSLRPLSVKKGDKVVFGQYAGTEVELGTEKYLILREDDIMAVVS